MHKCRPQLVVLTLAWFSGSESFLHHAAVLFASLVLQRLPGVCHSADGGCDTVHHPDRLGVPSGEFLFLFLFLFLL